MEFRATVEDERACESVVIRFCGHFDRGDSAGMERLFSTNGVWKRADGDLHGIEQLSEFMRRRKAGTFVRHVLTNLRTTVVDADNASVHSYVTVYRHDFAELPTLPAPLTGPDLVGTYRSVLVRESGEWRLAHHEASVDFKGSSDPNAR